jgi:hypothetical protein
MPDAAIKARHAAERRRKRRVRASLAVLATVLAGPPATAQLACPKDRTVVTLELNEIQPTIDRSITRAELTALSGAQRGDTHTLGMYGATWTIRSQSQLQYLKEQGTPRPRGCVWLESVKLTVSIDPRLIRIARELRPDSCRYRSVLEHERKHQAVDDDVLARRLPWLRDHLAGALKGMRTDKPRPVGELDAIGAKLVENATRTVTAAWQQLVDERDRLQREVDTPQEYERVRLQCRD